MEFTSSRGSSASPIPPDPPPPEANGEELRREDAADGRLLARLSAYCVDSYFWKPTDFEAAIKRVNGRSIRTFSAQRGSIWWRPFALVFLPVNYAVIACAFVLLGEVLVLAVAMLLTIIFTLDLPSWFATYVYASGIVLACTAAVAAGLGLALAIVMALFPRWASARGFGYVDKTAAVATIVLCGSNPLDNFTINAWVWPLYRPLRHAGFHRAWRHIRQDVIDWLETALPNGGDVILTGHSLGGALAQIAAYELPARYRIRTVASFGSSRIGGKRMRRLYMQSAAKPALATQTRHFTHADDAVPRLPPPLFYKHVGRGIILYSNGELVERTADPLWLLFWKITLGVQAVWSGQTIAQVIGPHGTLSPKAHSETTVFLRLAQKFNWLRGISPVAAPLATILYFIVAAYLFYFRAFRKGFGDHGRRYYRDTLAARLIEITDAGAVNVSEFSDRRRLIRWSYWNDAMYCKVDAQDGSSLWFGGEVRFTWPDRRPTIGEKGGASDGTEDHGKAKEDALKALDVIISSAIREQQRLRRLAKELIDISDGQYTDDSQLKQTKFDQFRRWEKEIGFRRLSEEEQQRRTAQYQSNGLNIGHMLVVWSTGQELFIERVVGRKSWIWPYPYDGTYDEALEQVRTLLRAPLVDPASTRAEFAALIERLHGSTPMIFGAGPDGIPPANNIPPATPPSE